MAQYLEYPIALVLRYGVTDEDGETVLAKEHGEHFSGECPSNVQVWDLRRLFREH
jgi:hypothetical protein